MMNHVQLDSDLKDCIELCSQCHDSCTQMVSHCLGLGGEHASPQHIALLLDCAQLCHTSADFMQRQSSHHAQVCDVCADVCEACAQDCERLADGDSMMLGCANICRQCAESCRMMV